MLLPDCEARLLDLDRDWDEIAACNPRWRARRPGHRLSSPALQARPGGGIDALLNFLVCMSKEPGLSEYETLIAVTTISFDIAALELYLHSLSGRRVVPSRVRPPPMGSNCWLQYASLGRP